MKHYHLNFKLQCGLSTLTVVLLLLIAIMIPGIAIMRSTIINQQITSSGIDHSLAFQAAEAGLISGEDFATTKPKVPDNGCAHGICRLSDIPVWKTSGFWQSSSPQVVNSTYNNITVKYILEYLGISTNTTNGCTTSGDVSPDAACSTKSTNYRITAYAKTDNGAKVILQSNFMVPY